MAPFTSPVLYGIGQEGRPRVKLTQGSLLTNTDTVILVMSVASVTAVLTVYLQQPFEMTPNLTIGRFFSLRERITCFFCHSKVVTKMKLFGVILFKIFYLQ